MRIFRSTNGDPMLVDSLDGLTALHDALEIFISSAQESLSFLAIVSGSPEPYEELLFGLKIVKSEVDSLRHSEDAWLILSGSENHLRKFQRLFKNIEYGSHRHWYSFPISLIIEADSYFSEAGG